MIHVAILTLVLAPAVLGGSEETKLIAAARRAARSKDPATRIAAWQELAARGRELDPPASPKLAKALLGALEDESHEVRRAVLPLLADCPYPGTLAAGLAAAIRDGTREGQKHSDEIREIEGPGTFEPPDLRDKKDVERARRELRKLNERIRDMVGQLQVHAEWMKAHNAWMKELVAAAAVIPDDRVTSALIDAARSGYLSIDPAESLAAALLAAPTQLSVRAAIDLLERLDDRAFKAKDRVEEAREDCATTREHLKAFALRHDLPLSTESPTPEAWRQWFATVADRFPKKHERRRD